MLKSTALLALLLAAPTFAGELLPAPVRYSPAPGVVPLATPVTRVLDPTLPPEGYRLKCEAATAATPAAITLAHRDAAGLRYGLAILATLKDGCALLPAGEVADHPRYPHRGLMLDESRHFYGPVFVKRLLTLMGELRLNVFHWHLTDGPGWRIDIPAYPKLTAIGAWRVDKTARPWDWRATEIHPTGRQPGDYGGYYTAADIAAVLAHAKSLGITVIPEIECPGHAYAALIAYPECACDAEHIREKGLRGHDVFCASAPATRTLLKAVLDRTCELFPEAPYIHLGGDEVSPEAWSHCPRCNALMRERGLNKPDELRGDLLRDLAAHLAARGKKTMCWDEAAGLPLPADTALTVWRTGEAAQSAAASGQPLVLCPIDRLYLDYGQTEDGRGEPPSAGPGLTLSKVYGYMPPTDGAHILGVQANLWTEHVTTAQQAERLLLPRLIAFAEVAWSPADKRDEADFRRRLPATLAHLRRLGYTAFGDTGAK